MKILLATGIFYPDVGGPAIHVNKIAERLTREKYEVVVIAYGDDTQPQKFDFKIKRVSRKYPIILQWIIYSLLTLKEGITSDFIYAFDPTAAGVPAFFSSRILSKPFLIRIGGDPIWERQVESGKRFISIEEYYKNNYHLQDKPTLFKLISYILKKADVIIIYNVFWKNFFQEYFGLSGYKMKIIKNPAFKRENGSNILPPDPVILFAGRFVAYKNLPMVIEAFEEIRSKFGKGKLMLIGVGPEKSSIMSLKERSVHNHSIDIIPSVPQTELFRMIKESSICIGPALTEFNPNFILEALSFGKPVILSRGNGLSVELDSKFLFDPKDKDSLIERIEYFFDQNNYSNAVNEINEMNLSYNWDDVTDLHLKIINDEFGGIKD